MVVKVALWWWTCVVVVVVVREGGVDTSRWMGSGDGCSAVVMTWQCCQLSCMKKGIEKCVTMQTSANGLCSHCSTFKCLTFSSFHSISFLLYYN